MPEGNEFVSDALRALQNMRGSSPELDKIGVQGNEDLGNQGGDGGQPTGIQVDDLGGQPNNVNDNQGVQNDLGNQGQQQPQGNESGENASDSNENASAIEIDSPIFGGKKVIKPEDNSNGNEPAIENAEAFNEYLKSNFEIEDIKSLSSFVESAKKNETLLSETSERLANAEKLFQLMNPELYEAVVADLNGQDWKQLVNKSGIDYRKNVNDYSEQDLVEAFFPGEISNEDWEEYRDEDGDPKIKKTVNLLLKQSREKFEGTKKSKEQEAQNMILKQAESRKAYEQSLVKASSYVESQIEGIDKTYVQGVVKKIQENGIDSLFYNENGTLKEDAVLRFVMAEEGFNLVKKQEAALRNRIESQKNQEIITRGANTPNVQSGKNVSQGEQYSEEAQRTLDWIRGMRKSQTY